MPWRVVEWDGNTETDLLIRQWDGATATELVLGSETDPVPPVDPPTENLFTAEITWPAYAAHRGGDPGPEHTLYAYRNSYATRPNTWAEGDMRVLSDGQTVVLCHDETIDNMAGSSSPYQTGNVDSFTPTQWETVRWRPNWGGGDDQPAMFLSDLINEYGPGADQYRLILLEIKRQAPAQPCIDAIINGGIADRTIVNSYNLSYMQAAAAQGLESMHDTDEPDFPLLVSSGINHVGVSETALTADLCDEAHSYGIKVWTYLANNTTERDAYLAMGVDGLYTNSHNTVAPEPPTPAGFGTASFGSTPFGR